MIRWTMYGLCMIMAVSGCGERNSSSRLVCEAEPQGVMVSVSASYPELLEPAVCESVSVIELEAFLLLPDEPSCFLDIGDDGISGCCPVRNLNRSLAATLVVRTTELEALLESTKLASIPSTDGQVIDLVFAPSAYDGGMYDSDRDGEPNIDEYCFGSL